MRDRLIKGEKRPVRLWWGFRYEEDVILEEELAELTGKYPNFSYETVLSAPTEAWQGKKGHVTEHVLEEAGKLADKNSVVVYLCGNNAMIAEVSAGLFGLGFPRDKVYWEKYF